jgi:hypothetical protein
MRGMDSVTVIRSYINLHVISRSKLVTESLKPRGFSTVFTKVCVQHIVTFLVSLRREVFSTCLTPKPEDHILSAIGDFSCLAYIEIVSSTRDN